MDVRFCEGRNHRREARVRAAGSARVRRCALLRSALQENLFLLDKDLHGGRQTLPWDYFRVARHQGTSPQITDERWTYDKKCGVSLSYVPFPRSLLPFGVVKEGEQLGIDLVFQGRAHAVRPAGNDLELGAFHKLGGR